MSTNHSRQRIGLFGGTFDPIHVGHLLIAEQVREQLELEEVRFIPAATSPHKLDIRATDAKHRLEMVQLAIGGNPRFTCDNREMKRGGTSYTVDTLQELKDELPLAQLVLLMGNDSLNEFHTWREPARICELAFVAVVGRGGQAAPALDKLLPFIAEADPAELKKHLVNIPQIEISSTDIRARVAGTRSIRYQVHPAVEAYISAHVLYRDADA